MTVKYMECRKQPWLTIRGVLLQPSLPEAVTSAVLTATMVIDRRAERHQTIHKR